MSFLAPLFLLGTLAVALPILFHLSRRTTKERIPFSSLMFLMPTPPRVTRRSRLEHLLLLILRCLVIGLLALGFARPFIQRAISSNQTAASGKRLVILVDTSASMRRGQLWRDALDRADKVLKKTTPADQVAIFTFDRKPHPVMDFEAWNAAAPGDRAALAYKRLAEPGPGWSATHLGGALIAAAELMEFAAKGSRDSAGEPKEIVLISDLQEGSRLDGLQGYEWPRGVKVTVETVTAKSRANAGLHWVAEPETSARATTAWEPRVRVSNAVDSQKEQFQVRWMDQAAGNLFKGSALEVYAPPGQTRVVQAPKLSAEWTGERLVLSGDDELFDNTLYWAPPQAESIPVLFVGNDSPDDPAQSLYYLRRAFQETHRQTVRIMTNRLDDLLSPETLGQAQLVVLNGNVPIANIKPLQQYMTAGKIALFLMETPETSATLGAMLGTNMTATESQTASGYAMLGQIDLTHPVFAPFADPRFGDFTRIHFWRHRSLSPEQIPQARVLGRFDNHDAAIAQFSLGKGYLLVLTSSWRPADSQLALSSKFVPLLYSILEQSRGVRPFATQYAVGEEVNLDWLIETGAVRIQKPDGAEIEVDRKHATFAQTDSPGIYTVKAAQRTCRFAVNIAPEESRTALLPMEELERLKVPVDIKGKVEALKDRELRTVALASEMESRQKLWRWSIVAALAVLIMETGIAGWLTRQTNLNQEVRL